MASEAEIILQLTQRLGNLTNVDEFCHDALQHVATLLDTEKCSLLLARQKTKGEGKELASRLWSVSNMSTLDFAMCDPKNEFVISFEEGIAGYVALNNTSVNASNVYEHPNFLSKFDELTGFTTRDILCQPLLASDGTVCGVVEVANKKSGESFTEDDEKVLSHFVGLCSVALQQSRRIQQIARMQHANKLQADMATTVAENWGERNFDNIFKDVLANIAELIQCQRYTLALALVDNCNIEGCLLFAKSYDLYVKSWVEKKTDDKEKEKEKEPLQSKVTVNKLKKTDWVITHKLIQETVEQKKTIILAEVDPFGPYKLEDAMKEFMMKKALCTPFIDGAGRLLGVLLLANRKGGFKDTEEEILESIRPYILNGLLYANGYNATVVNVAKKDVAEEIVKFHTRALDEEVDRVKDQPIPPGEDYNLYEFTFSDISLHDDETVLAAMRMFTDLDSFNQFKIPCQTMLRWVICVRRCYRPVYYHNWRHGFNVAHTMFLLQDRMDKDKDFPNINNIFTDIEKFALVIGSFCHDIDHRGTNNAFLIRAGAPLAVLYNSSTLENHHYDTCLRISNMDGNNIFEHFTGEEFAFICEIMKHAILATDLALYFQRRNTFKKLLENKPEERDWTNNDNKMLLMSMMMTACDLSSITKPWDVQQLMAVNVTNEFYDQGDQEKQLFGTEPIAMMDRSKSKDLPKMQIGFINGVCSMVYEMMADFCNGYAPLRDGMRANREHWTERAKAEGLDMTAPKVQDKKSEKYEDMWEKYYNMDPEYHIWGMEFDEAAPEKVKIEQQIWSPTKSRAKGGYTNDFGEDQTAKKPSRSKRHKKKFGSPTKESKSPTPSARSDSSSKSKSTACCIM